MKKQSVLILVVEDQPSVGYALRRILLPFDVKVCSTVAAARPALLREDFDAIVSDVDLGDGSGIDLFEEIVVSRPENANRYVFVSGSADVPEIKARLERTGAPYFLKPFSPVALKQTIESIVSRGRGR